MKTILYAEYVELSPVKSTVAEDEAVTVDNKTQTSPLSAYPCVAKFIPLIDVSTLIVCATLPS